jgi:hypothetical protein
MLFWYIFGGGAPSFSHLWGSLYENENAGAITFSKSLGLYVDGLNLFCFYLFIFIPNQLFF